MTRHGWQDPDRVFAQRDYPQPYGHGGIPISRWGCTAAALSQAARLSGVQAGATPATVAARALAATPYVWAPGSSLARMPQMARAMGFTCPDADAAVDVKTGTTPSALSIGISDAIDRHGLVERNGFAWVQVDYTGDDVGEHWLLAFAYDEVSIYCTDSAIGAVVAVNRKTLRATVRWGSVSRKYRIVRAYPLTV